MPRFQTISSYLLLALNVLLVFLLIFQEKVALPVWLQPVGRMHPMLLHLPIGLLVLVAVVWAFRREFEGGSFTKLFDFLLAFTALTAVVAALMGFFLSREEGYTAPLLDWHKYSGVALSLLLYGLVWARAKTVVTTPIFTGMMVSSVVLLLVTGHFGASLTHGEDYLFPTQQVAEQPAVTGETPVFEAAVRPILEAKCVQCHNEQKMKGELLMTTVAGLLKGGKNGPIWTAGDALNSHLIQRANLPLDDKKHMPPRGKAQLTPDEIAILTAWVQVGADTKQPIKALAANSPLKPLVEAQIKSTEKKATETPIYTFDAASAETIQKLNNPFRTVVALAHDSPALQADFFVRREYKPEQLTGLLEVKKQVVSLNLSNMPIKDDDLKTIAEFENLEKLILNNTDVTGQTLAALQSLSKLKLLGLSGTKVTQASLRALTKLPQLEQVFVWNTPVSKQDVTDLQKLNQQVSFQMGYVPSDTEILKLNPPMLVNESMIVNDKNPITFKHPLRGVTIRYTTDGTEPDSTSATVYDKPFKITDFTQLKVRATKEKWYASEVLEFPMFIGKIKPERVDLRSEPHPKHPANGGASLTDLVKGKTDDFDGKAWLAFKEKPFEAVFTFDKPTPLQTMTLSYGRAVPAFIAPPTSVEVWAGSDLSKLKLVQKLSTGAIGKGEPYRIEAIQASLKGQSYQVVKVIARPLMKLPEWHGGKGQPAWLFVDEVLFN